MKYFIITLAVLIGLGACSSHAGHIDKNYYNRANSASEKAIHQLDRE